MWIVKLALHRPYTFMVAALLVLIISPLVILRTPVDIFPNINIPVVSIIWNYTGLTPKDLEGRITSVYERVLTTTVNDIEHIESQSMNGVAVIKVFFHPCRHRTWPWRRSPPSRRPCCAQMPAGHDAAAHYQLQRLERARSCSSA